MLIVLAATHKEHRCGAAATRRSPVTLLSVWAGCFNVITLFAVAVCVFRVAKVDALFRVCIYSYIFPVLFLNVR
jgi:hypothetical protein